MNELTLDGKIYVSSKRAAEITGYAKDYVGQLCREGHVEARLVGRNWYVLESSIRNHRFGTVSEEPKAAVEASPATSTWEAPRYKAETPIVIPTIVPPIQQKEPEQTYIYEESAPATVEKTPILSDMQNAWQEWFSKKGENEQPAAEPGFEEPETREEAVPIHITPMSEEEEAEYESDEERQGSVRSPETYEYQEAVEDEIEEETFLEPIRSHRFDIGIPRLVLQSIFVGISLVAIATAAVGTGFATRVAGNSIYRSSEINYIAGVSVLNR